jgi:hypothetical protein
MGNENQLYLNINHYSPLAHLDPSLLRDKVLSNPGDAVQVVKIGIPVPSWGPIKASFDGMIAGLKVMGDMESAKKLADSYKTFSTASLSERPEETDFGGNIEVVQYESEAIARQYFENPGVIPGFGSDLPLANGMTMEELFKSDAVKKSMSKEQLKEMELGMKKIKEKMPELKQAQAKANEMYKRGKCLGFDALYIENANTDVQPKPKVPAKKKSGMGGCYGYIGIVDPLPKNPEYESEGTIIYQSVLVNKYIIRGAILGAMTALPSGKKACYSLTQTKEVSDTVEGITSKYIVPIVSDYASEGYINKEEAEEIVENVISKLTI